MNSVGLISKETLYYSSLQNRRIREVTNASISPHLPHLRKFHIQRPKAGHSSLTEEYNGP